MEALRSPPRLPLGRLCRVEQRSIEVRQPHVIPHLIRAHQINIPRLHHVRLRATDFRRGRSHQSWSEQSTHGHRAPIAPANTGAWSACPRLVHGSCEGRPHSARRGHGLRIAKATSSVRISVLIRQRRSQWALTPSQRDLPEVRVGAWVLPIPPRVQHVQGERSGYSMVHAATTAVRSAALAISVR